MVPEQRSIVLSDAVAEVSPAPLRSAFQRAEGYVDQQQPTLWLYWRLLIQYRYTILAATLITASITAIVTFRMTPQYEAVSRLAIKSSESDILGFDQKQQADDSTYEPDRSEVETQVRILESDALASEIIRKLGLTSTPGVTRPPNAEEAGKISVKEEEEALALFHKSLIVMAMPRTRIIELRYISPNPALAARILDSLTEAYVERSIRSRFESTTQASTWLGRQLSELQMKVQMAQQKLVDYQRQNDIVGLDDKQNIVTSRLDQLNKEMTEAESDRIRRESDYKIALSGDAEQISQMSPMPTGPTAVLDKLRAQEADLKTQSAQLSTKFGSSYPQVVEVKAQLEQVQANIRTTVAELSARMKNNYIAALNRERMLRVALEQQKQEANGLNQRAIEYNILKRDAETSRDLYEGLLKKLKEAEISAGLRSTNIQIVDQARVPSEPSRPRKALNIALGVILGLVTGIVISGTIAAMDSTVHSGEEAESITGLGSLGFIPQSADQNGKLLPSKNNAKGLRALLPDSGVDSIVSLTKPNSNASESYRALRTSILLSSAGKPPKVILVTSALPQEGKTTTSINMAVTFAQRGGRVLIIDCDLRRPSLHKRLNMDATVGLSTLLAGNSKPDEVVKPVPECPNLYAVPAGPHSPRPAELVGSAVMSDNLAYWKLHFDHIILDSPPVLSVTDAVILSSNADTVALVVRANKTPKAALRRARAMLAQVNAKVAGVVVNAVNQTRGGGYYYYGSYKNYGSYYSEESL